MSDPSVPIQKVIVREIHKIIPYTEHMEKASKDISAHLFVAFSRTGFKVQNEPSGVLHIRNDKLVGHTQDDVHFSLRVSYQDLMWHLNWYKGLKPLGNEDLDEEFEVPYDPVEMRFVAPNGAEGASAVAKMIVASFGRLRELRKEE